MKQLALFLSLLFLSGCSPPCIRYPVEGAGEFVLDSYRIRQGKLSILEMQGREPGELPCELMQEYCDSIAEDDILNIAVYHPTRCDLIECIRTINSAVGFRVRNGCVQIPDIPPVQVEGLTLDEAQRAIEAVYRQHIRDIELFISYRDRLARKVEIAGMTSVPCIAVDGKIRLYEVLSKAHLPNSANFFKSYVSRGGSQLPIDLHRLMVEGDMSQNIVMQGGDRIFIAHPQDSVAMVMGEVLRPTPVPLPYGFLSLREALVAAGGIPYTGNRNCIQVIRGGLLHPKIYLLSWEHIVQLPNESLLLIPGDTVYVSEKPITKWNRFISQLLPSLGGAESAHALYRALAP